MPEENIKRVLIVISNLGYGGAERQVVEIANHMDKKRFEVYLCSLSSHVPLAGKLNDPDRLHIIEKKSKYDISVIFRLTRLIRQLNIDLVHGFLFDAEIASRLAGRLGKVKVCIGSERNSDYQCSRVHRTMYLLTGKMADLCIANSSAGAEYNRKLFGYPENFYRIVRNGVDTNRFFPSDNDHIREKLGFSKNQFLVGMFASFKKQKNHPSMLEAAKEVRKRHPDIKFLLVGEALFSGRDSELGYKGKIRSMVAEYDLEDACVFLGPQKDVEDIYNICDITLLPSFHEGTPNVALESMACGVPVVASDVADNALVIPHEKVGYIFTLNDHSALADHICQLYENPEERRKLAYSARHWIEENYSLKKMADNMADVYAESIVLSQTNQ